MNKKSVLIICGGVSAEHQVSLFSAKNIISALHTSKFEVHVVGITKRGEWLWFNSESFLLDADNIAKIELNTAVGKEVKLTPGRPGNLVVEGDVLNLDVIFPIMHGPFGEDGKIQGLLECLGLPYVGAKVLGSAIGMDKDVSKRLLRDAGIPIGNFLTAHRNQELDLQSVMKTLGSPLFVKPANMGSSVGVSKVFDLKDLQLALNNAFKYDSKVLIESFMEGREIECAILEEENIIASVLGEVTPNHEFYSYEAKYLDENGAQLIIPAMIPKETTRKIRDLAVKVFKTLECSGFARVDFFLKSNGDILVNEINTIPGFTDISMYPQLWSESGVKYGDLIEKLIEKALTSNS